MLNFNPFTNESYLDFMPHSGECIRRMLDKQNQSHAENKRAFLALKKSFLHIRSFLMASWKFTWKLPKNISALHSLIYNWYNIRPFRMRYKATQMTINFDTLISAWAYICVFKIIKSWFICKKLQLTQNKCTYLLSDLQVKDTRCIMLGLYWHRYWSDTHFERFLKIIVIGKLYWIQLKFCCMNHDMQRYIWTPSQPRLFVVK